MRHEVRRPCAPVLLSRCLPVVGLVRTYCERCRLKICVVVVQDKVAFASLNRQRLPLCLESAESFSHYLLAGRTYTRIFRQDACAIRSFEPIHHNLPYPQSCSRHASPPSQCTTHAPTLVPFFFDTVIFALTVDWAHLRYCSLTRRNIRGAGNPAHQECDSA
jgi:hypothetical protein